MEKLIQQLTKVRDKLKDKMGREPTIQEIANEAKISVKEALKALVSQTEENNSATLQFFAIYEKRKKTLVLPCLLNTKLMSMEEMNNLTIGEAMSGEIKIPLEPKPWSKISPNADYIFLALQSRISWGAPMNNMTNLLKVETVRVLIEQMEKSLNSFTWGKDYLQGKFNPKNSLEEDPNPSTNKLESSGDIQNKSSS